MKVIVLGEHGYEMALFGIGLSYGHTSGMSFNDFLENREFVARMEKVAQNLKNKQGGENKFLRQITVIIDAQMPLYWWKQADQYRIGCTTQSESTMHTLMRHEFDPSMFENTFMHSGALADRFLTELHFLHTAYKNAHDEEKKKEIWNILISVLPSAWLQRRILSLNYAVLQNMITMRKNHKLKEWHEFCRIVYSSVQHPELLPDPAVSQHKFTADQK